MEKHYYHFYDGLDGDFNEDAETNVDPLPLLSALVTGLFHLKF